MMRRLFFLLLPNSLSFCLAFSSGADPDRGVQPCDGLTVCERGCPSGMQLVAPPERSDAYTLRTGTGTAGSDTMSYVPGELLELYLTVVNRTILGKANAGSTILGMESAKVGARVLTLPAHADRPRIVRSRFAVHWPSLVRGPHRRRLRGQGGLVGGAAGRAAAVLDAAGRWV